MRVLNAAKCVSDGFKNNKSDHSACTSLLTRDWDEIHHCLPLLWAWGGMENLRVSDNLTKLSTLIIISSLCSCWDLSLWQHLSCCVLWEWCPRGAFPVLLSAGGSFLVTFWLNVFLRNENVRKCCLIFGNQLCFSLPFLEGLGFPFLFPI